MFTTPHESYQGLMGDHSQTVKSTLNLLWKCYHNLAEKTTQIKIEVAPKVVQCNFSVLSLVEDSLWTVIFCLVSLWF